jgi:hypothetical protein
MTARIHFGRMNAAFLPLAERRIHAAAPARAPFSPSPPPRGRGTGRGGQFFSGARRFIGSQPLVYFGLLLVPLPLHAQLLPEKAEDYFHHGAQYYVHGKKPEAMNEIITGLKLYPTDPLLNGMVELLKKEEEQQKQQQQQQQQQQDQEKQDQEKQQQQQKQQQNKQQDQQQQDQQQQNQQQQQQQQDQQKDRKDGQGQQKNKAQEGDQKDDAENRAAPGEMTPQEAKQLLDSQKGEEKLLPANTKEKARDPNKPFKDW